MRVKVKEDSKYYNIKKLARVKAQQNQPRWKAIETKQEEKQRNGNKNKPDSQRIKGKNKKEKTKKDEILKGAGTCQPSRFSRDSPVL